jgi:hypothetical protein
MTKPTPDEQLAAAYAKLFPRSGDSMLRAADDEFRRDVDAAQAQAARAAHTTAADSAARRLFPTSYQQMAELHARAQGRK